MTDKYAVLGNPISHSKSPQIHAAFAKQTNQDMRYEAILVPLDGFKQTIDWLRSEAYSGVNVTVPFKEQAYELYGSFSPDVHLAQAANTLIFSDFGSGVITHNTDGIGLIRDITKNLQTRIAGKSILLLGAGGAAKGVYQPLLVEKPSKLVVANRTLDKAQKIVSLSTDKAWSGVALTYEELDSESFDIVINATSSGLNNEKLPIPNSVFASNCLAYDMMYGRETPFMAQARAAGAQVADGLGMLVEQAAQAFYLWREVRPATQPVIEMLRASN